MKKRVEPPAPRRSLSGVVYESARRAAYLGLARIASLPRCGATCKQTGAPCRLPGTGAGGRCYLHGGKTPAGPGKWHRTQLSKDERRMVAKLARLRRDHAARERRLAAMSEERRAEYRSWLRSHDPDYGRRLMRKREVDLAAISGSQPKSDEARQLENAIAALELKLTAASKRAEAEAFAEAVANREGIFG